MSEKMARRDSDGFWVPKIAKGARPMYLAVADALSADILSGELAPGTRLPPQRTLAEALEIDFTTVTRAYAEASKRGLVEGKVGQGTYVRPIAPPSAPVVPGGVVDMSMNLPPRFSDAQLSARMWRDIAALEETGGVELLLRYQEPGGTRADRSAGAAWLSGRLGDLPLERVLVCPGAQGALLALLGALTEPGDVVCAEALTYPGLLSVLAHLRLRPVGVPMDGRGLLPEAFREMCREHRPKVLYCNPTLHNPTTATLPLERRKALVGIARAHGIAIIEDDAYGALPKTPVPPLASLGPDVVYHVAGLAKCLAPALRIAYLVLPEGRTASRIAGAIRATAAMASPLTAAIASRWIESGTANAVLEAIRSEAAARRAIAQAILPGEYAHIGADGFHVWLELPPGWPRAEFVARLRTVGIGAVSSDAFAISTPPEAVRLGLGVPASSQELSAGLTSVAALLTESPAMSSMVV
jgi:DNA-binding transcriptional MocR family regulator